jgi:DNA-binding response OmpR family regulator
MRALVIDDQREFFDSVLPTLTKSGFVSEYAADISSAQQTLENRTFDLVLTDLQMAPGNWGGLEVIKTVREIDEVVPLFVVSGKGSLAECIQALRLGADDYLQKEVFGTEFIERVQPRFTRPYAIEHFPSLIAYLFRLFEDEQQEYTKARRLVDVYENTIKLLSLIIIAEQTLKSAVPIPPLLEKWNLKRPALGSYVSFLFERLGGDWSGNFLAALRASDLSRLRADCDRLTACRNDDFGHSTVVSATRANEIVETFSKVLLRLLNTLSFLRQFRLFVAYALRYDGTSFAAEGRSLAGSNLHHPMATIMLKEAIATGDVVIVRGVMPLANLNPLVRINSSATGDSQVYKIYNKLGKNGIEFDSIPK